MRRTARGSSQRRTNLPVRIGLVRAAAFRAFTRDRREAGRGRHEFRELVEVSHVEAQVDRADGHLGSAVGDREVDLFRLDAADVDQRVGDADNLTRSRAGDGVAGQQVERLGATVEQGLTVLGLNRVGDFDVSIVDLERHAAGPCLVLEELRAPHTADIPGLAGFRGKVGVAAGDDADLRVELRRRSRWQERRGRCSSGGSSTVASGSQSRDRRLPGRSARLSRTVRRWTGRGSPSPQLARSSTSSIGR